MLHISFKNMLLTEWIENIFLHGAVISFGQLHVPYVHQMKLWPIVVSLCAVFGATDYYNGSFTRQEAFLQSQLDRKLPSWTSLCVCILGIPQAVNHQWSKSTRFILIVYMYLK